MTANWIIQVGAMMQSYSDNAGWWRVIKSLADLVSIGYETAELDSDVVKEHILNLGFSETELEEAMRWLEHASVSGCLSDTFAMMQEPKTTKATIRVASAIERAYIPDHIWGRVEKLRWRGLISSDTAERIIEGLRNLDTTDWEEDEVVDLLSEFVCQSLPNLSADAVKRLLRTRDVRSHMVI